MKSQVREEEKSFTESSTQPCFHNKVSVEPPLSDGSVVHISNTTSPPSARNKNKKKRNQKRKQEEEEQEEELEETKTSE